MILIFVSRFKHWCVPPLKFEQVHKLEFVEPNSIIDVKFHQKNLSEVDFFLLQTWFSLVP